MPVYKVSITLVSKKRVTGIKEHTSGMIEVVFNFFRNKAISHYGGSKISDFDCMMISKQSKSYKEWLECRKQKTRDVQSLSSGELGSNQSKQHN